MLQSDPLTAKMVAETPEFVKGQEIEIVNSKQTRNFGHRFSQMHTDSKTNEAHRLRREKNRLISSFRRCSTAASAVRRT